MFLAVCNVTSLFFSIILLFKSISLLNHSLLYQKHSLLNSARKELSISERNYEVDMELLSYIIKEIKFGDESWVPSILKLCL